MKWAVGAIVLAIVALALRGLIYEPSRLDKREEQFNSWPNPPLKVVFFSDLHAGSPFVASSS